MTKNKDIKTASRPEVIEVHNGRVNNLKGVDVTIPRNSFTVVTGLSGSGKSSLAFDTLYAEGQRRYVESLSAYARQFMGKMHKPEADYIHGLPPAIAVEQKVTTRNPRSTVGTSTEIYHYLQLLFGRLGRTYSPVSGAEVKRHTPDDVVQYVQSLPEGTRVAITAPVVLPERRRFVTQLDVYLKAGYSRLMKNNEVVDMADLLETLGVDNEGRDADDYRLLIDRLSVTADNMCSDDERSRIFESVETAFFEGADYCRLHVWLPGAKTVETVDFSRRYEQDGITFIQPSPQLFNFNNPFGACPRCEGFGRIMGIDESLVIPNRSLSLYDDAVFCWRGDKMSEWKQDFIRRSRGRFPIHTPYYQLSDDERRMLWDGIDGVGITPFFDWVSTQQHKIQYRVMLARYRGKTECPKCHGARLRPEAMYVRVGDSTIDQLVKMPVERLAEWFATLQLSETEAVVAKRILTEITSRLKFLCDVGLGYLTLDRLSSTLSGGESQRINLATSLGSSLMGSMYILDEPSIGLHPRDTQRLIGVLKSLQHIGNTVIVVEHDEEMMRAADWLIDVGPKAGRLGGEIVYQGAPDGFPADTPSYTARYLNRSLAIPVPKARRRSSRYIEVVGAREHNLKNIDVRFPLGVITAVTGVSGSGKSTLVRDILYRSLKRHLGETTEMVPGQSDGLRGDLRGISAVEFVDQNPIGKSSRSNPATYLKAYDEIRKLFASQQLAVQMGMTPAHFSFNTDGGRCPECKGEGTITIEMQFMADITIECEACHGKRFMRDVLDVHYRGKDISDVLDMTIDEALEFFGAVDEPTERRIVSRLKPLQDVGLGYIKLGQSSSTLSGGENQRVKLAYYLGVEHPAPTLFIFDEPTTGLHFHDINILMRSINRLVEHGHTIVIIEHNLEVVKQADHVIDIGPEGGDLGGRIVAQGAPEQIAAIPESHTGRYLKQVLDSK